MLYQTSKNLYFTKLDKTILAGDVIELEVSYADEVNEKLKDVFPEVAQVLTAVGELAEEVEEVAEPVEEPADEEVEEVAEPVEEPADEEVKPKRTSRKSKPAE